MYNMFIKCKIRFFAQVFLVVEITTRTDLLINVLFDVFGRVEIVFRIPRVLKFADNFANRLKTVVVVQFDPVGIVLYPRVNSSIVRFCTANSR